MLGLFYLFFISQPDDQCVLSGSNKHIASLTCLSIVNLWRILSSGAILVSYSPKRLSINLLHLFFCLYSFSRVSFLYKLKKELLINYKLPKPYQFKKQKIIIITQFRNNKWWRFYFSWHFCLYLDQFTALSVLTTLSVTPAESPSPSMTVWAPGFTAQIVLNAQRAVSKRCQNRKVCGSSSLDLWRFWLKQQSLYLQNR